MVTCVSLHLLLSEIKLNTVIQIDILMLTAQLNCHKVASRSGRFGAAGHACTGQGAAWELTDVKRLGQCFSLDSRNTEKTVAHAEIIIMRLLQ